MSTSGWELWSDIVGFIAGVVMLAPVIRADRLLRFIADFRRSTADAVQRGAADPNLKTYSDWLESASGTWSFFDGVCLRAGAGLLVISFALKLCHHLITRGWFG